MEKRSGWKIGPAPACGGNIEAMEQEFENFDKQLQQVQQSQQQVNQKIREAADATQEAKEATKEYADAIMQFIETTDVRYWVETELMPMLDLIQEKGLEYVKNMDKTF